MRRARGGTKRAGFTMVELLMVVGIIAVVAALLVAGVSRVMQVQARTETQSDITQMTQALNAAKTSYGHIECLPSQLILYPNAAMYRSGTDNLTKSTANVFRYMFGKRFISDSSENLNWGVTVPNTGLPIAGPEVLAFYLGGIPDTTSGPGTIRFLGFAKDVKNPTLSPNSPDGKGRERTGPFFQYKTGRLVQNPNGFVVYNDPYGTPYVFFGARTPNNYDPQTILGVSPYFEGANKWLNPNSFQIISAGRNKAFGQGGQINPKTGVAPGVGDDDLSNFSSSELGNPIE